MRSSAIGEIGTEILGGIRGASSSSEVLLATGVLTILAVLVVPLPPMLLDLMLAFSISLSLLILITALFIERPLDFNAFPMVLLIATMLRLALNLATTRLILSSGHEGSGAAGHIIEAFGRFLMQGNFLIGAIVFAILVIVNFVVITKGSGRIAEVGARFSLDAMPGKQMAIDADLSAGLIDEDTARRRRKDLEEESSFFGAMDGAAKFVRGDAVAGLLITAINLVGGLIIGTAQMGMSVIDAVHTFTLLTIGDGLVSQVPALIVSVAAGLLVSKAGVEGRTDTALIRQLGAYPKALGMTSAISVVLAALPGLPTLVFLAIAAISGFASWTAAKRQIPTDEAPASTPAAPADESIAAVLVMDPIRLELGYALLGLIGDKATPRLTDQIKALRRQLALELGFVLPSVRIQDNIQLPANSYTLKIKEMEAGRGDIRASMLLVMDPQGQPINLPGEPTTEPTFGLAATWISPALREEASVRGMTVVDPATVVTTHLTELVKDNLADLLTYAETQKLLGDLPPEWQKLVQDLIPARISMGGMHRVLQGLLTERVSIRDLPTILEAVGEALVHSQNTVVIVEHVRSRLARQISTMFTNERGYIPIVTLSPVWEQLLSEALVGTGEERQLAVAPDRLQEFVRSVRDTFEALALRGELPALVTTPSLRPYVRSLIERFRSSTAVLSQNEIHPKSRIKTMGQV